MAPVLDFSYFPPLANCLNGEQLILSWKTAHSAISDFDIDNSNNTTVIQRFFEDQEVLERLSKPFDAFPSPSSNSKTTFEQRTSAINVTPSTDSQYDIKEIKEDALWLSKVAEVDEVSALKIVVEEWQSRSTAQLLGPFSDEELTSIEEASGNSKYARAIQISSLPRDLDPKESQEIFTLENSRRSRIFSTYLKERRYILKTVGLLLCLSRTSKAQNLQSRKGKEEEAEGSWLEDMGKELGEKLQPGDQVLSRAFETVKRNWKNLQGSNTFSEEGWSKEIELQWICNQITEATHALEIAFEVMVRSNDVTSSQIILEWLRLLQTCGYFDRLEIEENSSVQALMLPLQALTITISIAIFSLGSCVEYLRDTNANPKVSSSTPSDHPYILNSQTLSEIQAMLLNAAETQFVTAGPAILAWSTILRTMAIRITECRNLQLAGQSHDRYDGQDDSEIQLTPVLYEDFMEQIMDDVADDPIDYLALSAVNECHAFDTLSGLAIRLGSTSESLFSNTVGSYMRLIILELISNTTAVGYIPEVVQTTISTITGGEGYWDIVKSQPLPIALDPATLFLRDDELRSFFFNNAMSRYPFEPLPFLKIINALAASPSSYQYEDSPSMLGLLQTLSTFTNQLPADFVDYETIQEEDNNNNIQLTCSTQMFSPRSKSLAHQGSSAVANVEHDFLIPIGTRGRIISDSGPKIALWYHEYSGLKYFGKLLETFLAASDEVDDTTGLPADRDSVRELIEIFAGLLLGLSKSSELNANWIADSIQVLEIASSGLSRNRDIVTVIFDIFEEELQTQSGYSGSEAPLEILISCTHFINALLPLQPRRVWPLLAQSGLLGAGRGVARLPAIVESVELVTGQYDFLISCCYLYANLIEEVVYNTAERRTSTQSKTRLVTGKDTGTGIPDHVLSKTLSNFTRYLIDVLESSCTWKFSVPDDNRRLIVTITTAFDGLLGYVYGTETCSDEPSKRIMDSLSPSSSLIVESFLSSTTGVSRFQPLLQSFYVGLETPDFASNPSRYHLWRSHVIAGLTFSKTLLRVGAFLGQVTSQLENQIFRSSPLIARLYAANDAYRNPVISLFEGLVLAASKNASEPPSLLGYLGPSTAKNFLHVLSDLDKPLSRQTNVVSIWHFFSLVISTRQQWFANYILTGKTPREALQNQATGKALGVLNKPFLTTALEELSRIESASQLENVAKFEFVALAQNFWPWTVYASPRYEDFIRNLSEFMGNMIPLQPSTKIEAAIEACYQSRTVAYIAEMLAMHLFHTRQMGTTSPIKDLLSNLTYFSRFAVAAPGYNSSLHGNLKQNFESRYKGLRLQDLKRTSLDDRQSGDQYYYSLSLADKMLSLDKAWRRPGGFRNEVALANVNMSLVDAQIALFQNWKFLAIELSNKLRNDVPLQRMLAKVANDCLMTNARSKLPEDVFARLSETRADFALVIVQRLIEVEANVPETKSLLTTVSENIRVLRGDFELPLADSEVHYYRSLLKLLFLSLRVHANKNILTPEENLRASMQANQHATVIPIAQEVLKQVVARGLRELAAAIHDSAEASTPEDVALLTGILQAILQIPGIELCYQQIVTLFTSQSTARTATTLFSWSDSLAINGDPIYGELSILFLLELSSIPTMAEQLAIDGILGHIASANITSYLRRGNVNPFADSTGLQRCYSIWVRGILPLLLNLLDSVQSSIASEVAIFLNQFPALLTQASLAFESPTTNRLLTSSTSSQSSQFITLSTCSEVHNLALINLVLNTFRQQGLLGAANIIPKVNDWDPVSVGENVDFWLSSRALLRERLVPMGEREIDLSKKKSTLGGGTASLLEEKVVNELLGIKDVLNGGVE